MPDSREALEYIGSISVYILFAAVIFFGSIAAGYLYSKAEPEAVRLIVEEIVKEFGQFKDYSLAHLLLRIFAQNTLLGLVAMLLGLGFGILSLLFLAYNGVMIGLVIYEVEQKLGLRYIIAGLTPHGVIEVPTILICVAIGMRLGIEVINKLKGKSDASIRRELKKGMRIYIFWIVPLLFIAALVEVLITPLVIYYATNSTAVIQLFNPAVHDI